MVLAMACAPSAVDQAGPGGPAPVDAATTLAVPTTPAAPTTTTAPVPADIQDLVARTTMTDRGRRIFMAASPAIEDPATFAVSCALGARTDASVHTQGCYALGRIHLLAPERAEGRDLLVVVAAHELLHAVYASLGPAERSRVDAELDAARAGNDRLEERLKPYGTGPTIVNEIHSILGSEFDGLSPTLEAHYAQFFADRAAVVAVRRRTLGAREDEIRRLRAEVSDLDARITTVKAAQEQLRGDIRAYNAQVLVINGLIDRYNAQVDALNASIDEYNALLGG